MSGTGGGHCPDAADSVSEQSAGAFVERGAGGEDIVDQHNVFLNQSRIVNEIEGIAQVLHAPATIKMCLGLCVMRAGQSVKNRDFPDTGELIGEESGLIVAAFPKAFFV